MSITRFNLFVLVLGIVIVWFPFEIKFVSFFRFNLKFLFLPYFIAWLTILFYLFVIKYKKKYVLLYTFPLFVIPILTFLFSIAAYISGSASFVGIGTPTFEYSNLDKRYRCYKYSLGSVRKTILPYVFFEDLIIYPNNLAIKLMFNVYGPMEGSYQGYYPGKQEAYRIVLLSSTKINDEDFFKEIKVNNQKIFFEDELVKEILLLLQLSHYKKPKPKFYKISLKRDCIIISNDKTDAIVLVSYKNYKVFACYYIKQ